MSTLFKVEVIDRVMFARFPNPPSKTDVQKVLAEMATHRERIGKPLLYVGLIDSKSKIPNAEERNHLSQFLAAGRAYCEVAHLVIEGSELQNSLQRVIISGMLIVTRTYDNFLSVHKSVDSVAPDLLKRLGKDPGPILRRVRELGLAT
ncbi:MAG: DofB protein [Myxococcaceae bacterium]|nr:DofB protein [Myxococcaceae bacterium]